MRPATDLRPWRQREDCQTRREKEKLPIGMQDQ